VLARLLALNAERYAEEVALGLHSKGGGGRRGPWQAQAESSSEAHQQTKGPIPYNLF
jgi:hypothetical protein